MMEPQFAWHTISIDIVGPLPICPGQFKYLIVAIKELTKWIKVKPICDLGAIMTAKFIMNQIIL